MTALEIMKKSATTAWRSKRLWLFGFFVAAASSSGSSGESAGAGGGGELEGFPLWLIPVIVTAAILGVAGLVMHVISEGALIDGVGSGAPDEYRIKTGLSSGRRTFWSVLALKLGRAAVIGATVAVVSLLPLAAVFQLIPIWVVVVVSLPIALVAVPWLLTVNFVYEYGLRFVVLEGEGARDAVSSAWEYLHGRLGESIRLLVVSLLGMPVMGTALAVVAIPCAAVAGAVYLAAGVIPAAITMGALLTPLAAMGLGAVGTYRSGVWTHAFVDADAGRLA